MAGIYENMKIIIVLKKTMRRGMRFYVLAMCLGRIGIEDAYFRVNILRLSQICGLRVCGGWVIIATFPWKQSRYLLDGFIVGVG